MVSYWELRDGDLVRFRCRVGHSYGTESLATETSAASEAALWAAMRALEEKAAMQRRIADGLNTDSQKLIPPARSICRRRRERPRHSRHDLCPGRCIGSGQPH